MSETRRLAVALVRGLRGLDGTVRVEVLTDRPDARFAPGSVLHVEERGSLVVRSASPVDDGPGWWLAFEGRAERSAVDELRGRYLEADIDPAEVHATGAALWDEVVGCQVRDLDGASLGVVVDIYRAGGAEVYVVNGGSPGSFDVPAVRDFVRDFTPERGEIVVDAAALGLEPGVRQARPRRPAPPRWSRHGRGGPASADGTAPSADERSVG